MAKPATDAPTGTQPPLLVLLDNTIECDDTYSCRCITCQLERARAMRRGVRPSQPIPVKRKGAA